jgi:hypothetical protein
VGDEQAADEVGAAREGAVPDQHGELSAHEGDGECDPVGDREPHSREQVVGEGVAREPLEQPEHGQGHADEPVRVARLSERSREEHPHEVGHDRHHEDQRRPVVGLADQQAGRNVEDDAEGGVVGLRDRGPLERGVAPRVRRLGRAGLEEQGQVDPRGNQHDERVEGDLPEQERPVVGEDVLHRRLEERGDPQPLVEEADGVGGRLLLRAGRSPTAEHPHVFRTPHHDGPMLPDRAPAATR